MQVQNEQGYMIYACNAGETDYVACARQLAQSIKHWHPGASVALLTDDVSDPDQIFDHVIALPLGDQTPHDNWKLANVWQAGMATPYRETMLLESDTLVCSEIDHWWNMMRHKEVCVSTGCLDYYQQPSDCRFYRKTFDRNNLSDVYSAITYWRRSHLAKEFWRWVRVIFEQWDEFRTLLKFSDDRATTDVVFGMAAQILGPELITMPFASYPRMVHMKQHIVPTSTADWTRELVWEADQGAVSINTVRQRGLLHYHVKSWRPYD